MLYSLEVPNYFLYGDKILFSQQYCSTSIYGLSTVTALVRLQSSQLFLPIAQHFCLLPFITIPFLWMYYEHQRIFEDISTRTKQYDSQTNHNSLAPDVLEIVWVVIPSKLCEFQWTFGHPEIKVHPTLTTGDSPGGPIGFNVVGWCCSNPIWGTSVYPAVMGTW